jgi:hypothetical protein
MMMLNYSRASFAKKTQKTEKTDDNPEKEVKVKKGRPKKSATAEGETS